MSEKCPLDTACKWCRSANREALMRSLAIAAITFIAFVVTIMIDTTAANAVVYCKTVGVPKGCVVRPVARPTVVYCKRVGVPKGCVMR